MKYNPQGNPHNTYTFGKARFTFFTDRFFRIEWDPEACFTDEPTFAAVHRHTENVAVQKTEEGSQLCLKTEQIELHYNDQAGELNADSLIVHFKNNGQVGSWRYGEKDPDNLGGTIRTLDRMKGGLKSIRNAEREDIDWEEMSPDNGLVSRSGYAVIDDSQNVYFRENKGYFAEWPESRRENTVDLYFLAYGLDYKAAVRDASQVFGCMPLPPRYALGYWYSRYFPFTDSDIRDLVNTTRALEMPMDVMVIDMEWHKPGWTGYSWDRSYFPAPEKLLSWLKSQNIKTTLNLHPASGVASHEDAYPEFAKAMGMDPERGESIPFDSTDPAYMEHYFKCLHHPLEKEGVDFWWMDWQQGKSCSIRNLDPLTMLNKLHYEDLEKTRPGERPLNFSRYSGLGSGRYPIGFSGDTYICWESLAFQPGFTAGSANILYGYWSHDIGGHYRGELTPELFTRWMQFGVYSPILRVHSGADRRLWEQESPYRWLMIDLVRKRYELIPYIYSEMRRGHDTGLALCYPMYYEYPEVEAAYAHRSQYMFGEKMLLAPITKPVDPETGLAEQSVWLPEGSWIDTANGRFIEGATNYSAHYTLAQTPVFVRAGTITPGLRDAQHLDMTSYEKLSFTCHRGGAGHYRLYEDDGRSTAYEEDQIVTLEITQDEQANLRQITIEAKSGDYAGYQPKKEVQLNLPLTPYPQLVRLNGKPLDLAEAVRYDSASLTSVVTLGVLDLAQQNEIQVEFSPHERRLFDGRLGELAQLLALKEDIRALLRSGKRLLSVDEDRFYFDLVGLIERVAYEPETVLSELESFDANKAKASQICEKYVNTAREVLEFTETEKDPDRIRERFETLSYNRPVQQVIDWSGKALVTLPKLQRLLSADG